jgi:hypothetical protein
MNTLQRRLNTLEKQTGDTGYLFAAIFRHYDKTYNATLWQGFTGGLKAVTRSAFTDTEPEAVTWLLRELAGQKGALTAFFTDSEGLQKMAVCSGGKLTPAKLDPETWEAAISPLGSRELCLID